jgi:hypothetical protein
VNGGEEVETVIETVESVGFRSGVDILDETVRIFKKYQSIALQPDRDDRLSGEHMQLRLYERVGYVVTDTNNEFAFDYDGTKYVAALTEGHYASVTTFLAMLIAAMETQVAATWVGSRTVNVAIQATLDVAKLWFPVFYAAGIITVNQAEKTRFNGMLLGYNTGITPAGSNLQTAGEGVFSKVSPLLEFGQFKLRNRVLSRRPL